MSYLNILLFYMSFYINLEQSGIANSGFINPVTNNNAANIVIQTFKNINFFCVVPKVLLKKYI